MNQVSLAPRIAVPDAIDQEALRGFDPAAPVVVLQGQTMGTTWRVMAAVPDALGLDVPTLTALVQGRLDRIVAEMSHWEPGSHLCRFNRAAPGCLTVLPADFAQVMACAFRIADACGGAFDPAQGRLTDAWGLGPRKVAAEPDAATIAEAMAYSGWRRLAFDPQGRVLRQPGGVWLDLSGIAKGFAVDAVADMLAEHGVRHALVEVGGECTGRGMRPDSDPWWVDVEAPAGMEVPPLRVALHQLAIATSGDYLRGAHTLDPKTGRPAIHNTTAVTVLHRTCMEADAWATALGVLRPADARKLAQERGLAVRLLARDGAEWISPALAAMF
jgi:thiamine biosynthesis lipoprotein